MEIYFMQLMVDFVINCEGGESVLYMLALSQLYDRKLGGR